MKCFRSRRPVYKKREENDNFLNSCHTHSHGFPLPQHSGVPSPLPNLERVPVVQLKMKVRAEPEIFLDGKAKRLKDLLLHVLVNLLLKHAQDLLGVRQVTTHSHHGNAVTQSRKHILQKSEGSQKLVIGGSSKIGCYWGFWILILLGVLVILIVEDAIGGGF